MKKAGPIRVVLHPSDAARRQLWSRDSARIFNDRGGFRAVVEVSDAVRPGVALSPKGYWPKLNDWRSNANATVAERNA